MDGLEVDVGEKESGPLAVDRRLMADQRSERVIGDDDSDDDDERGRRDDAPGTPSVETAEGRVPRPLALAQEQPGDDETRDDEEDFDADVTTAETGYARVVDESQENGDGTHPLHVGSEFPVTGRGPRFVARELELLLRCGLAANHHLRCLVPVHSQPFTERWQRTTASVRSSRQRRRPC